MLVLTVRSRAQSNGRFTSTPAVRCESAPGFDPVPTNRRNALQRRSAFGPRADQKAPPGHRRRRGVTGENRLLHRSSVQLAASESVVGAVSDKAALNDLADGSSGRPQVETLDVVKANTIAASPTADALDHHGRITFVPDSDDWTVYILRGSLRRVPLLARPGEGRAKLVACARRWAVVGSESAAIIGRRRRRIFRSTPTGARGQ